MLFGKRYPHTDRIKFKHEEEFSHGSGLAGVPLTEGRPGIVSLITWEVSEKSLYIGRWKITVMRYLLQVHHQVDNIRIVLVARIVMYSAHPQ
jgi:hypothetical protein